MKALMDMIDRHSPAQEEPTAWKQVAHAVAGGASLALFFATIHLQAM